MKDLEIKNSASLLIFSGKRTPIILQTEIAECGLACLAMIAGHYGYETDLTSFRRKFPISSHGASLSQLIDIAGRINFNTRALKLELDQLPNLALPCLLHWDMNHFVVLTSVGKKYIKIIDPAVGERRVSIDEANKSFTGVALELLPSKEFKPEINSSKLSLAHFWHRITGLKRYLINIFSLSILLQFFALVTPFYVQIVVDNVILRNDVNLLVVLAIAFCLVLAIDTITFLLREYIILNFTNSMNIQIAANVFRHLVRLPMDYFLSRHAGDIVSRFSSLSTIRELFTTKLVAAVIDGLLAILTLIVMFFYNVQLAIVVLLVASIYLGIRLIFYRPLKHLTEEGLVAAAEENTHFLESTRAIQIIKLFQKEDERQQQWQNKLASSMNKDILFTKWQIGFDTTNKVLFGLENILVIYLAASFVMENLMTVGMLYAFMSYKNRFITSVNDLITTCIDFKMIEVHFNRLADMVFTKRENTEYADKYSSVSKNNINRVNDNYVFMEKGIEVTNLAFSYGVKEALIFNDLNFNINAGETVAIVGHSGCGKTTLMKCLVGLLVPTHGTILLDGKPIHSVPEYRYNIAVVMQNDQLLRGSIADNIACFDNEVDMEKVILHAKMACIHEEIIRLPMGYNTLVGDMGSSLSGGQIQRLTIARALYREPTILFMDEATSNLHLDRATIIFKNLDKLPITRIIVTHRPDTIKSANRIISIT